jgi:hypothetical protein
MDIPQNHSKEMMKEKKRTYLGVDYELCLLGSLPQAPHKGLWTLGSQ